MFRALAAEGINIEMISTSEIRITCLIDGKDVERGARALHSAYRLDQAAV
jgi:aspartate kinase